MTEVVSLTIQDMQARAFLEDLRYERNMSEHTLRAYQSDLESLMSFFERNELEITDVDHKALRAYLSELTLARYSRTTIARRLSTARSYFRFLQSRGLIDSNPADLITSPRTKKQLPRRISPKDMKALLCVHGPRDIAGKKQERKITDYRDQAILEFMYACGARISEVAHLRLGDVDFTQGQVKLFGKGDKERFAPLHPMAEYTLQVYLDVSRPRLIHQDKPTDAFFVSTRGLPMKSDALRKMFKETLRQAGLDPRLTPHDMRHTFASDVLEGGADLRSVQEMLGHVSLSTTQIYTHVALDHLAQVCTQAHPRS